ncbi:hypothetical protein BGZ93_005118 [Podila epicladia]|nr:hypothetical protein BGZ93_005118 [Podila epicladia]
MCTSDPFGDRPGHSDEGSSQRSPYPALDIERSFFLFLGSSHEGYTCPCTRLRSLRVMDTNIEHHPKHLFHPTRDPPVVDLNHSDITALAGPIDVLALGGEDDPPVTYKPNQIQAVLDIVDASPDIRALDLQLDCNSTLFCMAIFKSLSRLHSLDTPK